MSRSYDLDKYCENDIPKHKQKSDAKHQPRADHKHIYEVGAIRIDTMVAGKPKLIICKGRICTLCGRVGELNFLWSNGNETQDEIWRSYPHYIMNDFTDKVAIKEASED